MLFERWTYGHISANIIDSTWYKQRPFPRASWTLNIPSMEALPFGLNQLSKSFHNQREFFYQTLNILCEHYKYVYHRPQNMHWVSSLQYCTNQLRKNQNHQFIHIVAFSSISTSVFQIILLCKVMSPLCGVLLHSLFISLEWSDRHSHGRKVCPNREKKRSSYHSKGLCILDVWLVSNQPAFLPQNDGISFQPLNAMVDFLSFFFFF